MKFVHLVHQAPKDKWDQFLGLKPDHNSYDEIIDYDADVYTPEGSLLLKFRRNVIPVNHVQAAWETLRTINGKSLNRGLATSKFATKIPAVRKGGYVSNTHEVPSHMAVKSNIIGYFDRYVRTPYCRQTAWTAQQPEKWRAVLPFLASVSDAYRNHAPDRAQLQQDYLGGVRPEWIIPSTLFTTVTVNKNWQTATHTDQGDLKAGLSCITAMRAGQFKGCYLVFPHYRVGVDLQNCDLLMFDSHHMHGNTGIIGKVGGYERVSCVLYVREKMAECGTVEEELERAKRRKKGDPIYGD